MAKKKRPAPAQAPAVQDKPATLKELLGQDIVNKLKAQADELRAEEEKRREEARRKAEEARKAEQKRLENDFEHLLNSSSQDWRKYK